MPTPMTIESQAYGPPQFPGQGSAMNPTAKAIMLGSGVSGGVAAASHARKATAPSRHARRAKGLKDLSDLAGAEAKKSRPLSKTRRLRKRQMRQYGRQAVRAKAEAARKVKLPPKSRIGTAAVLGGVSAGYVHRKLTKQGSGRGIRPSEEVVYPMAGGNPGDAGTKGVARHRHEMDEAQKETAAKKKSEQLIKKHPLLRVFVGGPKKPNH